MTSETEQNNNTTPSCPLCTGGRTSWYLWIGILVFIIIFIYANRSASTPASFDWNVNLQQELTQASETNRPILVNFHATWCGPCKMMDREVFSRAEVGEALANWIPVSIDVDEDPKTSDVFGIQSMPTLVILSPHGKELARHEGTMSVQEFLRFIRSAEKELSPS